MENRNYYTISLSLIGVLKLVLNSFGMDLISDKNANEIANAVATILSFVGVIMTHLKGRPQIQFKAFVSRLFKRKAHTDIPAKTINTSTQVTPVIKTVQTTSTASEKSISTAAKVEQPEKPEPAPVNTTINTVQK